jgi:cellulose biosynthesis protein BcsQ
MLLTETARVATLESLAVPMTSVARAKIICAHDQLDTVDFRLQAQFFLDATNEVRFLFQRVFHDQNIDQMYDIVIFDCPPRLTTSAINALTCSDFVLIPTKLDRSSVTAVPRTLKWMATMGRVIQAKPLGIIANETLNRGGKLIAKHRDAYAHLVEELVPRVYGSLVFTNTVAFSNQVAHTKTTGVAAATEEGVRKLFLRVAEELRGRLGI